MSRIAVMYSGGTDSTAAVTLLAETYQRIHMLTYKHSGLASIENSGFHLPRLRELYGSDKFEHIILDTDDLFNKVTYDNYFSNLREYGFFTLTSCGHCKLAMHIRTLMYCLENGISEVADGANKNMSHFPAQMIEVIAELKKMYQRFGVNYTSPVFDYDFPDGLDWFQKIGLAALTNQPFSKKGGPKGKTTGQLLVEKGILDQENVKGKEIDRKMQGRCFQLTLLNVFALNYFIPKHGIEKYREITKKYYKAKIDRFSNKIEQHLKGEKTGGPTFWIKPLK